MQNIKNQNLIEFYKSTLASLGLSVTDDNYVKIDVGGGKLVTLTTSGKPLVLPTKDHIDSAVDMDEETGKLVTTKILYNPLNEDVIKGDSTALKKTKDIVETRLAHSFAGVCELLLTLASNKKLQTKTTMEINKFLSSLSSANNPGMKQVVDEKTIDLWGKLYAKTLDHTTKTKLLKLYLKKSGKYDGNKFNRLGVLTLPLLEEIQAADKDTGVLDVKLRNKDIKVFELLYTYIFKDMDEHNTLNIGSNDPESPGFISLFKIYLTIGTRLNQISKSLKGINPELYDSVHLNLKVTMAELDQLNNYARELAVIPSELELNRQRVAPVSANQTLANAMNQPQVVPPQHVAQQQVVQQPQQVVQEQQPQQPELSLAQKILYGNNIPIVPSYDPQAIMAQQAQVNYQQMQQPQQVRPAGINSIPVQQPQQMYAQPQQGQPMYPQMQGQPQGQPMYPQMQGQPQGQPMYGQQPQQGQPMYGQPGQPMYGQPQQQVRPAGINSVRY